MLQRVMSVILVMALLWCVWLIGGAVAGGWWMHADHYGAAFRVYSGVYYAGALLLTLGTVLYFLRRPRGAMVCALGYLPMLAVLLLAMQTAERYGWSGQTAADFGRTAAEVWRNGQMWAALPALLLAGLSAGLRVSQKNERDAAPAPSVLDAPTASDVHRQESGK